MSGKETVQERLARMAKEKKEATTNKDLVGQLHHESDGETDFSKLAEKLEERKAKEAKGENEGHVKMTIYVREDIAKAFNALITKRGQQKEFTNQALSDFIQKKSRELNL